MSHRTEVIKHEQPNDECIAFTIRCCGDPKTDSTTTINAAHTLSVQEIEASVDTHHDLVAKKHVGLVAGRKHLDGMKTKVKQHPEELKK